MVQNPAIAVLQRERDAAASRIDEMQAALKELRATLRSLEQAIVQLTGELPTKTVSAGAGPTLNEMILALLSVDGEGHTPASIAETLTAHGRETQNTTVSSVLSRLKRSGEAEKRDGFWYLVKEKEPPRGGSYPEEEAGAEVAASAGPTPASSVSSARKHIGSTTSLSGSPPIQFPLAREKGG